ncbi:MAG TPA: hypothetical protein VHQ47_14890 [Phycisphaerae bacterium]|nr:hypothetical protein [Phycisphaerae bacterium]
MLALRRLLLALVCLLPLVTLVHKDDLDHWDVARSAMAAPDEFSYLLLADSFLHGHGVHLHDTIGRDTFYPPGYPLLLAAAAIPFTRAGQELPIFLPHALNALLLCAATLLTWFLARQLLPLLARDHRRFAVPPRAIPWLALLIAALFAADWHVLEGALFVFSEPAFTLATLLWIFLALRWRGAEKSPDWTASVPRTLLIAALAMAAYTIRGAGLVCIAATLLYPLLPGKTPFRQRLRALLLILLLAILTKIATRYTDLAPNSYPHQLVNGLTHGGQFSFAHPRDYPALALRAADLAASHLDDLAQSFTPIPRVPPDLAPLSFIGHTFALVALAGWLLQLIRPRSATRLLDLYLLFYIALYLLWPFNMPRFWTPILPFMLIYALHAARTLADLLTPAARLAPIAALLLLLVLNAEELYLHLPAYQNRLNYVSDALADSAAALLRRTPDPRRTYLCVAGGDEHFIYAWYLRKFPNGSQVKICSPQPLPTGGDERIEALILRVSAAADRQSLAAPSAPPAPVFIAAYFSESLFQEVFSNLQKSNPVWMASHQPRKIFQRGIEACLWKLPAPPSSAPASQPRPTDQIPSQFRRSP